MSTDKTSRRINTTISKDNWELLMLCMDQLGYKGTADSLVRQLAIENINKKIADGEIKINSRILKIQGVTTWSELIIKFLDPLSESEFFHAFSESKEFAINDEILKSMVRGNIPTDLTPDYSNLTKEDMKSKLEEFHTYLIILQVIGAINYEGHKIDPTYAEQCIEIQSTNNSPIG